MGERESFNKIESARNSGIDVLKGVLIILVFVGHMIRGGLQDSFLRYVIYGFHMPLFLCVSGYLVNTDKLRGMRFVDLIQKYLTRPVIPWLIASLVYFVIHLDLPVNVLSIGKGLLKIFVYPYYHLWYIMGYLFSIVVLWIAVRYLRNKYVRYAVFICSLFLACPFKYLFDSIPLSNKVLESVIYTFRPQHLYYFWVGVILRKTLDIMGLFDKRRNFIRFAVILITVISTAAYFGLWHSEWDFLSLSSWLVMNSGICVLGIAFFAQTEMKNRTFEFIGKFSLPIYLYHVLIIEIILYLCASQGVGYYLGCTAGLIVLCGAIYFLRNRRLFASLVLGR